MSKASQAIREIRHELSALSDDDLEMRSWLRIDYFPPGPGCEGKRILLKTRLAGDMLKERKGLPKASRRKLGQSIWLRQPI